MPYALTTYSNPQHHHHHHHHYHHPITITTTTTKLTCPLGQLHTLRNQTGRIPNKQRVFLVRKRRIKPLNFKLSTSSQLKLPYVEVNSILKLCQAIKT
jgi:hypothetical protein